MRENIKKELYSWVKSVILAFILAFLCTNFLFAPTTVQGESMSPTFEDKDKVLLSKISEIERFDIIVFNAPDTDKRYIKRVIGLPGDTIEMKDDVLYVNGKAYEETYLEEHKEEISFAKLTGDFTLKEITGKERVPKGKLFVLGDNRLKSNDSRLFGFISAEEVIGEVKFRFYPL